MFGWRRLTGLLAEPVARVRARRKIGLRFPDVLTVGGAGMKRGMKEAKEAVRAYLRERAARPSCTLYELSVVADRAAGRELWPHLQEYERVLPDGSRCFWNPETGFLEATNPFSQVRARVDEGVRPVPGPFDAAVDMGPDAWGEKIRNGSAI